MQLISNDDTERIATNVLITNAAHIVVHVSTQSMYDGGGGWVYVVCIYVVVLAAAERCRAPKERFHRGPLISGTAHPSTRSVNAIV